MTNKLILPPGVTLPGRNQRRVMDPKRYTAKDVTQMFVGQAESQTDQMGRLVASAIGVVLHRLGESHITIGPTDINSLSKTHRVEIIPEEEGKTYTYRLVRIAPDDDETGDILKPVLKIDLVNMALVIWIEADADARSEFREIRLSGGPNWGINLLKALKLRLESEPDHKPPAAETPAHCAWRNLSTVEQWLSLVDLGNLGDMLQASSRK